VFQLKDYDHIILWLDYFNKALSRSKGRRIKNERAVFDPTIAELNDAAIQAGFEPVPQETSEQVRYPRRSFVKSGYIVLPKSAEQKKSTILIRVAEKMQKSKQKIKAK
jgi:signal recognition particle subunit SRP19